MARPPFVCNTVFETQMDSPCSRIKSHSPAITYRYSLSYAVRSPYARGYTHTHNGSEVRVSVNCMAFAAGQSVSQGKLLQYKLIHVQCTNKST